MILCDFTYEETDPFELDIPESLDNILCNDLVDTYDLKKRLDFLLSTPRYDYGEKTELDYETEDLEEIKKTITRTFPKDQHAWGSYVFFSESMKNAEIQKNGLQESEFSEIKFCNQVFYYETEIFKKWECML